MACSVRRHIIVTGLLLCGAASAQKSDDASELDLFRLDQNVKASVVSSVTKSEQTIDEAPAIVETFTREQIFEWGYDSVADVLRHVVGFYVEDDHIQPNVAVRGVSGGLDAESNIIKVMIDGHSVAFRSTSGNWLGPELVPLTAIERIEVLRGPASALYGADAFLAVINIITRSGESLNGAQIKVRGGFSTVNAGSPGGDLDASAGFKRGHFEAMVGARLNYEDRSGLKLPPSSPAATIPDYNAGHTAASGLQMSSRVGFGKLSYSIGDHSTVTVSGYISSIDRGGDFSPWTQLSHGVSQNGVSNGTQISLYQWILALNARTTRIHNVTLTLDAEYFNGRPTYSDRIEVNSDVFWVRRRFAYSGTDINLEAQAKLPAHFQLVGGIGFIYDQEVLPQAEHVLKASVGSLQTGQVLPPAPNPNGDTRGLYNIGAYLQLVWAPISRLTLTGGVRYDYQSVYGSQPSGRLAAVSRLFDKLYLKVMYGGAFKAPSPFLLYSVPLQVGDVIGNPNLQPQYVHTIEGQLSYKPWPFLHVSTGITYSLLQKAAQITLQGVNQVATNIGEINSLSWETQIEANYKEWIKAYVNGEYNHTVRNTGYVGYRAALIGTGNIVYPSGAVRAGVLGTIPKAHLRLGLELSYFGPRSSSEANTLAHGSIYTLPDYAMLNASISTTGIKLIPDRETTFHVVGKNLTGAKGPDAGFSGFDYPLAPRTFWFELRQQL
jgi:outer membrane receptor for ferrienterochelin and colicins